VNYVQPNFTLKSIRGNGKQCFLNSFAFAILTGITDFNIGFDIPRYCVPPIPINYFSIRTFYLSVTTLIVQSFKNLLLLFGRIDHTAKGNILSIIAKKIAVNYAETRNFSLESVLFFTGHMLGPDGLP
jgi:hypothetical protein